MAPQAAPAQLIYRYCKSVYELHFNGNYVSKKQWRKEVSVPNIIMQILDRQNVRERRKKLFPLYTT